MATVAETPPAQSKRIPVLQPGDHLSRAEFERRYHAMPLSTQAELVEGIVYLPSPARIRFHGKPHSQIMTWLGTYQAVTPMVEAADNTTVRLDDLNEPQPDGMLRIRESHGGQSQEDAEGYLTGAPEFCAEIAASSAAYDVHEKKDVFRRHGVREYLVWLVEEEKVEWWVLQDGSYVSLKPNADGILESEVFPGLRLNVPALLGGDLAQVLTTVREGTESPAHTKFVKQLSGN